MSKESVLENAGAGAGDGTGHQTGGVDQESSTAIALRRLILRRGNYKGVITRTVNFVNSVLFMDADIQTCQVREKTLKDNFQSYIDTNEEIAILSPSNTEDISEIEEKYLTILATIHRQAETKITNKASPPASNDSTKLPPVNIPTFTGNYADFRPFFDLFQAAVGDNPKLQDAQRLYYLRSFLAGEALDLIKGIPPTNENYKQAIQIIKERYDNKEKLVAYHINELLDLQQISSGSPALLRKLISSVKQQLCALTNLGEPTTEWNSILICIVSKKLDAKTNHAYQLKKKPNYLFSDFLQFLERRAAALEGISSDSAKKVTFTSHRERTTLTASPTSCCKYCKQSNHKLFLCTKFKCSTLKERTDYVIKNNLCKLCLNSHRSRCNYTFRCATCKGAHNTMLHDDNYKGGKEALPVTLVSSSNSKYNLLPTVKIKIIGKDGSPLYVKAILDCGSQSSCITKKLLPLVQGDVKTECSNLNGIGGTSNKITQSVKIQIISTKSEKKYSVNCAVVEKITNQLPHYKIDIHNLNIPSDIELADEEFNIPNNVHLLLDANIFFQALLPEKIQLAPHGPYLHNTEFGYIVAGNLPSSLIPRYANNFHTSLFIQKDDINHSLQRFWETESVPEIFKENISEHELCENIFNDTVKLENKRFQVALPLKVPIYDINLCASFRPALQRFYNLENKFKKQPSLFPDYKNFIDEYVHLKHGHYHDISSYDLNKGPIYFLPHHAVINMNSNTSRLRVVFDGSMKVGTVSLNDMLLNGPVMQKDLFDILISFRLHDHIFVCDIKKMYRQIMILPEFKSLQNILWRPSQDKPVQCIQLDTVTYGLKSSAYLATRCLTELANRYEDIYPVGASILKENTYVDDVLYSSPQIEQILEAKQQLISILCEGSFELHKWHSNVTEVLQGVSASTSNQKEIGNNECTGQKTLGLNYNLENDSFLIQSPTKDIPTKISKREVLSFISRFYDPLGLVGPIFISAKILMQKLWDAQIDWDTPLPTDLKQQSLNFIISIINMPNICVKRGINITKAKQIDLLGFADASMHAYGCVLYLRVLRDDGTVGMHLLCSKSRVNPMNKKLTIPRLELNSSLLLTKTVNKVSNNLKGKCKIDNVLLFSDSKIVLAWICTDPTKLQAYVGNRVAYIQENCKNFQWEYVNTLDNPADLISRGTEPNYIQNCVLWWQGPEYLHTPTYKPNCAKYDNYDNLPEVKMTPKICMTVQQTPELNIFSKYSSITKMQRVLSYILRFIHNCKCKNTKYVGNLKPEELSKAMSLILKHDQHKHFQEEISLLKANKPIKSSLKSLSPFLDKNQILRLGGRLQQSNIPYNQKHPIILGKNSYITHLIIYNEHIKLHHAGQKLIMSSLNQHYWLINSHREIRKVIHKCIKCFKLKAECSKQLMGTLPRDRVTPSRPFQKVGIDFAGPFQVKQARVRRALVLKAYIAIFVCFVTKAIHIELVSNLSTEAFLAGLKRFIGRRNAPTDIFCDNAANFKGANNKLQELYQLQSLTSHQNAVQNFTANLGIKFHFIPAYSPVFGGLWEAGVKSVKYHIKRVVGDTVLTYEELYTYLIETEQILNSRPLTCLSNDPTDTSYLTPGHFLTGAPMVSYPEQDLTEVPNNRLKFWKLCTKMQQCFWKSWNRQYLIQLQNRPKWQTVQPNIKVGSLVIMIDKNTPPLHWPVARVISVRPGPDGKVRVLEVKNNKGTYLRSIHTVCLLPIDDNQTLQNCSS